ncbi:MAG TPA: hydrolase [Methanocella sp.]|nr:hydrolase [Methanocella sp.]
MSGLLKIDKNKTAIVVIDLQKGIVSAPTMPYAAADVVGRAASMVNVFRKNHMPVFLVHVAATPETALRPIADDAMPRPPAGPMPTDWAEFVPELTPVPTDVVITKRQWGAFYGTDLDLRLRRGGLDTIILCGISTDYGVESTARFAYEYGYQQIFAEDAMSSRSEEQHLAAIKYIFSRMGRVRKTGEILQALE